MRLRSLPLLLAFLFPLASAQEQTTSRNGVKYEVPNYPFEWLSVAGVAPGQCVTANSQGRFVGVACGGTAATKPALATWLQSLHGCLNQVTSVAFLTDSRGMAVQVNGTGGGPSATYNRYIDRFKLMLQGSCPSHGTGIVPVLSAADPGNPNPADAQFWNISGGWNRDATFGPSWQFPGSSAPVGMVVQMNNGTSANFNPGMLYDRLRVFYVLGAGSSLSVSTSNGTSATIAGAGSPSPGLWDSGKLAAPGFFNSTLTCSGSCGLYAAEGALGSIGISVSRLSAASAPSLHYSAPNAFAFLDLVPQQLVVTDYGTNDANPAFGVSSAQFAAGMGRILSHELAQPSPPSLVVIEPPQSSVGAALPAYLAALQASPLVSNATLINFGDEFGPYNPAANLFSDGIHPGDAGSFLEVAMFDAAVLDSFYRVPPIYGTPSLGPIQTAVIGTGGTQQLFAPGTKPMTDARFSVVIGTGSNPTTGGAVTIHLGNNNSYTTETSTYPSCAHPAALSGPAATTATYLGFDAIGGNILLFFATAPPPNSTLIYDLRCDNGRVY